MEHTEKWKEKLFIPLTLKSAQLTFWEISSQSLQYRGVWDFPRGVSFDFENLRIYLGQKLCAPFSQPHLEASGPISLFRYQYVLNSWIYPPP